MQFQRFSYSPNYHWFRKCTERYCIPCLVVEWWPLKKKWVNDLKMGLPSCQILRNHIDWL